jgi:hypothetical protein
VIELTDNLEVWTTDETSTIASEGDHHRRDLLTSPNHQEVQPFSSTSTRTKNW